MLDASTVRADFSISWAEVACSLLFQLGFALSWSRCSLACSTSSFAMDAWASSSGFLSCMSVCPRETLWPGLT